MSWAPRPVRTQFQPPDRIYSSCCRKLLEGWGFPRGVETWMRQPDIYPILCKLEAWIPRYFEVCSDIFLLSLVDSGEYLLSLRNWRILGLTDSLDLLMNTEPCRSNGWHNPHSKIPRFGAIGAIGPPKGASRKVGSSPDNAPTFPE